MLKSVKWICIFYWKSNFITFAFELIEWELKKKSKKKNKRRNTNIQHTYTHTKQNSNRDETPIDREEIFIHLILNWFFLSFWISSKSHTRIKHTAQHFVLLLFIDFVRTIQSNQFLSDIHHQSRNNQKQPDLDTRKTKLRPTHSSSSATTIHFVQRPNSQSVKHGG